MWKGASIAGVFLIIGLISGWIAADKYFSNLGEMYMKGKNSIVKTK